MLCVCFVFLCIMCMPGVCGCQKKGALSPGIGVRDGYEPPCPFWQLNLGPREEEPLLLTSEPPLRPEKLEMTAHTYDTSTQEAEAGSLGLQARLGCLMRWDCLKMNKKLVNLLLSWVMVLSKSTFPSEASPPAPASWVVGSKACTTIVRPVFFFISCHGIPFKYLSTVGYRNILKNLKEITHTCCLWLWVTLNLKLYT